MKFDETTKTLEVSVRELAEADGYERIGFDGGEGWSRLGLGSELHSRVLKQRCADNPQYRAEVHLQVRVPVEEWTAIVTGRLDGVFPTGSGEWHIEEFKSDYLPSASTRRSGAAFERHQQQLRYYCLLWEWLGNGPVKGGLIYVDLTSDAESFFDVHYDPSTQARDLQLRLQQLLAIWRAEQKNRERKAEAAALLPFPHREPRPVQQQLINYIREALGSGQNILAEAPTGSGKTAAALYPALAHGLASGRQLVFLTSKTLQQRMAVTALEGMNQTGAFRTQQIRAKEKMCANDRVICHEEFCPYARAYPEKMESTRLVERLREKHWHLDPSVVFESAKSEQVCPFQVQLELAAKADALVADYNYVFDPGVALRHLNREDLDRVVLVIDEAHNLPDRARKIFSPELLEEDFGKAAGGIFFQVGELFEALSSVLDKTVQLLTELASGLEEGNAIAEIDPPTDALRALWQEWEPVFIRYLVWKQEMKIARPEDLIVDVHFGLQRFIAMLNLYGPGFTCVVERRRDGIRLALVCLDPARALAPIFRAASSTVLMSATLSPFEVFRRTLGLGKERTRNVSLPPPFPREHRKVMILPQVSTTYNARQRSYGRLAQIIVEMAQAQQGNSIVLFPSYQFLGKVVEQLPAVSREVVVQQANFSDAERNAIFKLLANPPPEGVLLFAVLGGMYAEGVDYPGELLSGVFIVSPGLPQVSFERELLRRYFDQTEQAGFEYAYLQPGMTRVIQAAGRLIRSETDRGVIALICRRFLQDPYANHLPRDWFESSPSELIAQDPAEAIRSFWSSMERL